MLNLINQILDYFQSIAYNFANACLETQQQMKSWIIQEEIR